MSKFAPHRTSASNPRATSSTVCQKCLGSGHFTYQCKNPRPYVSRPSRTEQLENPRLLSKLKTEGKPSVEVPEEFKSKSGTANRILEAKEKERAKGSGPDRKKAKRESSRSSSESSSSDSETDSSSGSDTSDSASDSSSGSGSRSSSRSADRERRRRVPQRQQSSSERSASRSRSRTPSDVGSPDQRRR